MKLSRVMLVVLLAIGSANTLKCYTCESQICKPDQFQECGPGQMCMIKEQTQRSGPSTEVARIFHRACVSACTTVSVNLGSISTNINCCSSDFCNQEIEQANSSLQCHGCLQQGDDFQCRLPRSVRCQSTQNKCAKIHASLASGLGRTVTLSGCASASFCFPDQVFNVIEVRGNVSCCDHNMCNGSEPTITMTLLHPILLLLFLLGLISL